jgi:AcrR family transcriptional regulator
MRIKKFDRIEPDERKALLVKSAIRCLTMEGYAGLSVRKITKEANVSQGLVNHHFGSINVLITCAYQDISNEFVESIRVKVNNCQGSAFDKLDALFCAHFLEEQFEQDLLKPWLVFWSLVKDSNDMADAYEASNGKVEKIIKDLLMDISREEDLDSMNIPLITQGLMALLDGLWARQCLAPDHLSLENALQICRNWAKGFRAGLFVSV